MNFLKRNSKHKTVILKEGKFIRFCRQGSWEFVGRNNCSGIVIILVKTKDNKVLFTEQYRIPVKSSVIEFPAGLINDRQGYSRESIFTAAKRELLEETGYRAKRMEKVIDGPVSGGFSSDRITVVRAYDVVKESEGGGDETEAITVHAVDIKKVDQWLKQKSRQGCLVDPKVYAGLYFLKNCHER
jgi:ADP-ribose pyrophosphatase